MLRRALIRKWLFKINTKIVYKKNKFKFESMK